MKKTYDMQYIMAIHKYLEKATALEYARAFATIRARSNRIFAQ